MTVADDAPKVVSPMFVEHPVSMVRVFAKRAPNAKREADTAGSGELNGLNPLLIASPSCRL